jgi:hypothetical protein
MLFFYERWPSMTLLLELSEEMAGQVIPLNAVKPLQIN